MCLYPKLVKNPKYTKTKKNGGVIPPVTDKRVLFVPIGCGNCIECRKQKAREWTVRLLEDIKTNTNSKFITLTFNTESIRKLTKDIREKMPEAKGYALDNAIATRAVRLMMKRWVKKYGKTLRHWLVTELGHEGTEHIHIHGVIWTNETLQNVEDTWNYGYVWKGKKEMGQVINYVNEKTINYIAKYVTKVDQKHPNYKPIILTSPGIGAGYNKSTDSKSNRFQDKETKEYYKTRQGYKLSLPIYYRNKLYTDEQKEKLWLNRLDKEERYVLGQKISIRNGDKEYAQALKYAQRANRELGYGGDTKNWVEIEYENQRRILKQMERLTTKNHCDERGSRERQNKRRYNNNNNNDRIDNN